MLQLIQRKRNFSDIYTFLNVKHAKIDTYKSNNAFFVGFNLFVVRQVENRSAIPMIPNSYSNI